MTHLDVLTCDPPILSQKCKRLTQNTKRVATSIGWVCTARP